jgi:hypothetical protein
MIHKIGVTYWNHGYKQQAVEEIKDRLYDDCERMKPSQCVEYLGKEQVEADNAPTFH